MQWLGLDKRTDENDLSHSKSPDTTNMFLYKGINGQIGPRKGKTFFNTTAYDAVVKGLGIQVFPNGDRKFMIALTNGEVQVKPADLASRLIYTYPNASGAELIIPPLAPLNSLITATLNHPSTTVTVTAVFANSLTYTGAQFGSVWFKNPKLVGVVGGSDPTGGDDGVGSITTAKMGLIVDGSADFTLFASIPTWTKLTYTDDTSPSTANIDNSKWDLMWGELSDNPGTFTSSHVISGIALKFTIADWGDATSGTITFTAPGIELRP